MSEKATYRSVLSNQGFCALWINQILVQLAYNTLNFALIIWVYKLVGSSLAVSILMLAIYLPVMLFGIFAGVFVDLLDKKKIILAIDISLAVFFLVFIFIKDSYPLILLNTFIINSLAQFFMPSESSSIPMLLKKEQLFLANSLFSLTLYGSFMLGFTLGGPVLNSLGINAVFIIGAGLLGVAYFLAHRLPSIKVSQNGKVALTISNLHQLIKTTLAEAKETVNFIKSKLSVAAAMILMAFIQGIIGILAVMIPAYLEGVLKIHATDSSYFVMLPLGLGMVTGALLVGKLFLHWPKRLIVIPAIITAGIIFILIAVLPNLANLIQLTDLPMQLSHPRIFLRAPSLSFFFAILAYFIGLCAVFIIIPCQTILQVNTPEENRGKLFALLAVFMTGFSAIPVILAGGLADLFGVTPIFLVIGIMIVVVGVSVYTPSRFFQKHSLSVRVREFLGLGHWDKSG